MCFLPLSPILHPISPACFQPVQFSSLDYGSDVEDDSDEDYEGERPRPRKPYTPRIKVAVPKNRENVYGKIPGRRQTECFSFSTHD